MNYPKECNTTEKKYQFVCKAKENARLLYNLFSKWTDKGITQAEYDVIPAKIKQVYPYIEKLSEGDWQRFFKQFKPFQNEIAEELSTQRARNEEDFAALPMDIDIGEISNAF